MKHSALALFAIFPVAVLSPVGAHESETVQQTCNGDAEKSAIIAMHKTIIRAHQNNDVESWLATEADILTFGGRGEVYTQDRATREDRRRAYLENAEFEIYEDMIEPIAEVSNDCTLGWVMVQVRAKGVSRIEEEETPIDWQSAWVELYKKQASQWRLVGAVSNFAPDDE